MALGIESDARDEGDINKMIVGEGLAIGLHDAESTLTKVLGARIAAQLHAFAIDDVGQNDGFAGGQQIVDKLVGIDFVGQRIVGHDGLRLGETGFQTGDDGL